MVDCRNLRSDGRSQQHRNASQHCVGGQQHLPHVGSHPHGAVRQQGTPTPAHRPCMEGGTRV